VYRQACGVDCRIARLSNPFGVGQKIERNQGAATVFMHNALAGKPILIYGDGTVVRDYIHISDVTSGLLALAQAQLPPGDPFIFNLASGKGSSLNDIVSDLESCLGRKIAVEYLPGRPYDVRVNVLDIARARETFGWAPRLSFIDGLKQTFDDYTSGARLVSTLDTLGVPCG
jgi:UDP-glucose 4-epimerase